MATKTKTKTPTATAKPAARSFDGEAESRARPIDDFPDLVDVLPGLAERSRLLADEINVRDAERKEISKTIDALMVAAEADSITGVGWGVVRTKGTKTSLSKERLLENGVTLDQIERSTTTSTYYYVQVRSRVTEE